MWLTIGPPSLSIFKRMRRESCIFCVFLSLSVLSLRHIYRNEDLEPIELTLPAGERIHVPVFHDESICCSNELRRRVWVKNGKMPLLKKVEGRAIQISDFIVEQTGRIALNEEQCLINSQLPPSQRLVSADAREII